MSKSQESQKIKTYDAVARLDSHLHLWVPGQGEYSWLTPDHGILYDTFTADQAREALAGAGVGQAILVQADDTEADTRAMLAAADSNDFIVGVVGWVPLEHPTRAEELLEEWQENQAFCGVRALIHDDPRPDVLELPAVKKSLKLLSKAGVPLDIPDAFPRHLAQAAGIAREFPDLLVVLDHLGKPPRADGAEQMALWGRQMRDFAALPNTVAKVSGLNWPGAEFSAEALKAVWEIALDAFGPEHLMFGGDWPVSLLGGSYANTVNVIEQLASQLTPEESAAFWSETARKIYRRR